MIADSFVITLAMLQKTGLDILEAWGQLSNLDDHLDSDEEKSYFQNRSSTSARWGRLFLQSSNHILIDK